MSSENVVWSILEKVTLNDIKVEKLTYTCLE